MALPVAFSLAFSLGIGRITWAATAPPLRALHGAVASDHVAASTAGVAALKAGGNAVDAACATALALGVANPHLSGIGGGGFAMVYIAKEKKTYALDFREKAPAAIKADLYYRDGKLDPKLSRSGGLAVAVPGEVRGLGDLVKRWGKLSFAHCVAPAEELARKGVVANARVADSVRFVGTGQRSADEAFLMGGENSAGVFNFKPPLKVGDTFTRPALAATLARLRKDGPDGLYTGTMAQQIAAAVQAAGGVMTVEDLAAYRTVERAPLETSYRGLRILSMPPPSSGGIAIAMALGILSHRSKDPGSLGRGSSAYLHLVAESLKHAFADRARYLGDTDFVKVPLDHLQSDTYHAELAARIKDDAIGKPEDYGTPNGAPVTPTDDHGTTHLAVIDAEGNAVGLTTTVNLHYGAHLLAGKTGIVLNNQMDDFAIKPGSPNAFRLIGTEQNGVAPGKRPLSSMSPTIVLDVEGRVKMVVGGAGGPTIISGTLQVLLNVVDGKMDAQAANATPRIHHQWSPYTLAVEADVPIDVIEGLKKRGHKVETRGHITSANVVVKTAAGVEAAAEYRSGGAPAGY